MDRIDLSPGAARERERAVGVLATLVRACRSFEIGLGWDGWATTADYADEEELKAALVAAAATLGADSPAAPAPEVSPEKVAVLADAAKA